MKNCVAIILLALCGLVSCGRNHDTTAGSELTKPTQDVINLWHTNVEQYEATNAPLPRISVLHFVNEIRELNRIIDQMSDSNRDLFVSDVINHYPTNGENDIYCECVNYYVRKGDRQRLVDLLSKRCDKFFDASEPVQTMVAVICFHAEWAGTLTNAFGVFFEAYERSQSPSVKASICQAVRRALKGYNIDLGRNDDQFMATAKKWEEARWQNLKPNSEYDADDDRLGLLFGAESEIKLNPN
jgi:hypothetical protein